MKKILERISKSEEQPYPMLSEIDQGIDGRVDCDVITRRLYLAIVLDNGQRAEAATVWANVNPFPAGENNGTMVLEVAHPGVSSLAERCLLARAYVIAGVWAGQYDEVEWKE